MKDAMKNQDGKGMDAIADIPCDDLLGVWIDVRNARPSHGQSCLIAHKYGVSESEYLCSKKDGWKTPEWSAPYYGQDISYRFENVTHWMPMPSSPNAMSRGPER